MSTVNPLSLETRRDQGRRQRQAIMDFLRAYMAEHGWAPSMREIADHIGTYPPNVMQHLRKLQAEGKIVLGGGPRMIRITTGDIHLR